MAMQEFLASYAVQVDEDGARRLQSILEENREAGSQLAAVFDSARAALEALIGDKQDTVISMTDENNNVTAVTVLAE